LDAELRSCIRQDFDETSGDGDRIIQVLDAPLLTRRKAIRQYGEDSSLRTDAEQLFEILCRLIEPASTDFSVKSTLLHGRWRISELLWFSHCEADGASELIWL